MMSPQWDIRKIIAAKKFHTLQTHPTLTNTQFKEKADKYKEVIHAYLPVDKFAD